MLHYSVLSFQTAQYPSRDGAELKCACATINNVTISPSASRRSWLTFCHWCRLRNFVQNVWLGHSLVSRSEADEPVSWKVQKMPPMKILNSIFLPTQQMNCKSGPIRTIILTNPGSCSIRFLWLFFDGCSIAGEIILKAWGRWLRRTVFFSLAQQNYSLFALSRLRRIMPHENRNERMLPS